jgi:hypothetical protein
MGMNTISISRLTFDRRALIAVGGALAVSAFVYAGFQGAPDYSALAANKDVEMHVSRLPVQSLDELSNGSQAVVVGRVVAKGATRMLQASGGAPLAFANDPAPSGLSAQKLDGLKNAPAAPARSRDNVITPPAGIPITSFTVQVSRSLQGGLKQGQQITIDQEGGEIQIPLGQGLPTVHRTIVAEHDPSLVAGQEQVFFLSKGDGSAFRVTAGSQGRFNLDAKKTLQPVDEGSPVGQQHKGLSVDELQSRLGRLHGVVQVAND